MLRRTFLCGVAASTATLSVSLPALATPPSAARWASPPRDPSAKRVIWPLFDPLGARSEVGLGWSLETLSPVRRGAMVLTLRHVTGRTEKVHICRHGHEPRGIAHTRELDLMWMNDGDGAAPTDESLGRVVKTLARLIRKNENATDGRCVPTGLLAHAQRVSAHGPRGILE